MSEASRLDSETNAVNIISVLKTRFLLKRPDRTRPLAARFRPATQFEYMVPSYRTLLVLFLLTLIGAHCLASATSIPASFTSLTGVVTGDEGARDTHSATSFSSHGLDRLDAYGGWPLLKCPHGPAHHFYSQKLGKRWWLCDPAGDVFWLKGVYFISPTALTDTEQKFLQRKYSGGPTPNWEDNWALNQIKRLKNYGFNTIGDFALLYVLPGIRDSYVNADRTIPLKTPYIIQNAPSFYSLKNSEGYARQPAKDIVNGVKRTVYNGFAPHFTDAFDPNFAAWLVGQLRHDPGSLLAKNGLDNDYAVAFDIDENDYTLATKAGSDFETVDTAETGSIATGHQAPHPSWLIMITSPTQNSNEKLHVSYPDKTVYSKVDFAAFMHRRYKGDVSLLNDAWGSSYTSFASDNGGWGRGTGLLDEDGSCPSRKGKPCWVGDAFTLGGETPSMKHDLDDYLRHWMENYFSVQKRIYSALEPGIMLTSELGGWGSPPRKEVLQAAAKFVDFFTFDTVPAVPCSNCFDNQARVDFIARYGGDKPWVEWEGFVANSDSAESAHAVPDLAIATQAQRGVHYEAMVSQMETTADSAGTYHIAGLEWWGWYDQDSQGLNWGLITPNDNPYDGKSSTIDKGTDEAGYITGGESANYSDFLSSVIRANNRVYPGLGGTR